MFIHIIHENAKALAFRRVASRLSHSSQVRLEGFDRFKAVVVE